MNFYLHLRAEQELLQAVSCYDNCRKGLGIELIFPFFPSIITPTISSVCHTIKKICGLFAHPAHGSLRMIEDFYPRFMQLRV